MINYVYLIRYEELIDNLLFTVRLVYSSMLQFFHKYKYYKYYIITRSNLFFKLPHF